MEILNQIWLQIAPYIGGVTLGGAISFFATMLLRRAFNKALNKIDETKIADKAQNKVIDNIKLVSFKHDIEPLVNSRLMQIEEVAFKKVEQQLEEQKIVSANLALAIEKLGAYFDSSVGISDDKKNEFKKAISEAKKHTPLKSIDVRNSIVDNRIQVTKEAVKNTNIER